MSLSAPHYGTSLGHRVALICFTPSLLRERRQSLEEWNSLLNSEGSRKDKMVQ